MTNQDTTSNRKKNNSEDKKRLRIKYLGCVTENQEDCQCIFPFKADGVSYNSCSDPYGEGLWCATAVDATGEYSGWGWCIEGKSLLVDILT